jgi:hypothetical protein
MYSEQFSCHLLSKLREETLVIGAVNPQWQIQARSYLVISNSAFCFCGFRVSLRINSDYFLKQR